MKKAIYDFVKKQLFFKECNCYFMKTESGFCDIVFISNTERTKRTKIVKTFDSSENVPFLKNTDRISDITILPQKLHFDCLRAEKNKTMKVTPTMQDRIALQKGQKTTFYFR